MLIAELWAGREWFTRDEEFRERVCSWGEELGFSRHDVKGARILMMDGPYAEITAFLRDADGKHYYDPAIDDAAQHVVQKPLTSIPSWVDEV